MTSQLTMGAAEFIRWRRNDLFSYTHDSQARKAWLIYLDYFHWSAFSLQWVAIAWCALIGKETA